MVNAMCETWIGVANQKADQRIRLPNPGSMWQTPEEASRWKACENAGLKSRDACKPEHVITQVKCLHQHKAANGYHILTRDVTDPEGQERQL